MKRKIILYIAESLDGFIRGKNGTISWLTMVEKRGLEKYIYRRWVRSNKRTEK